MSISALELLLHILDEVNFLLSKCPAIEKNDFLKDETLKRAFSRSFEIIGEASKNIPSAIKEQYVEVEWKSMARMRDKLIHRYFGVDYQLVWVTVLEDIPVLKVQIEKLIDDLKSSR